MATTPIPVRLDIAILARLERAAARLGTNRSALIKFCAQTFVDYFERHGGIASLPPDWREILRSQDGRTVVGGNIMQMNGGKITGGVIQSRGVYDPEEDPVKAKRAAEKAARKRKKK